MVVAACGDEGCLRPVPRLLLEAQDAAVERRSPARDRRPSGGRGRCRRADRCVTAEPSVRLGRSLAARGSPSARPAANHTVNASQWMPITSVCTPIARTATNAAASHASRRQRPTRSATLQRTNATTPAMPASTPSSVYVDSPARISTPVRFATTPALPSPCPAGARARPGRRPADCASGSPSTGRPHRGTGRASSAPPRARSREATGARRTCSSSSARSSGRRRGRRRRRRRFRLRSRREGSDAARSRARRARARAPRTPRGCA